MRYALAETPTPRTGRPHLRTAGLAAFVALVLVVAGAFAVSRLGDDEYVATPARQSAAQVRPGEAAQVLEQLQRAVADGDRTAAVDLAADDAGRELAGALVDNTTAAGIDEVTLRYVDESGPVDADGTWGGAVEAAWRFAGYDDAVSRAEVELRFGTRPDGTVGLAGTGTSLRVPVWMSGEARVRRTADTLVLAVGGDDALDRYAVLARRAVPVVASVVTTWRPPRLVVEVPRDLGGLERALDAEPGSYAAVAAVTTSSDGRAGPRVPVHVLVNPEVLGGLRGAGAQVVVSHEATHVATDAPASAAPTWLLEGLADYVALRRVPLPLSTTAAQVAQRVREDGLPTDLPSTDDFDPVGPHLGAAYEAAWLVCVVLADRGGSAQLLRLYDRLSGGADAEAELRALFGWDTADLVEAWRTRLASLPGA